MNAPTPDWQPPYQPPAPRKRRRWPWISLGAVVLLIVVISVAANSSGSSNLGPGKFLNDKATTAAAPLTPADPRAASNYCPPGTTNVNDVCLDDTTTPTSTTPALPPQEQQAIGAAQDYLQFEAFSRDGLIDQLSSSAGDGYPKDVATAAVDSLGEDWNAQAAKSAAQYLSMMHFSCSGLISQLDSSAGEKFTKAQATYGAHQTSACG